MNKFICICFSGLALIVTGCSKQRDTDREKMQLEGSVRSITNTCYKGVVKFGKLQKGDKYSLYRLSNYNNDNNLDGTKLADLNAGQGLSSGSQVLFAADNYQILFNKEGQETEQTDYNKDGSVHVKDTYQYNKNGKIETEINYRGDGSIYLRWGYKCDNKGNVIEKSMFTDDGKYLEAKFVNKYDDNGKKVKTYVLEAKHMSEKNYTGTLIRSYKYDNNGNNTLNAIYGERNGSLRSMVKMKYDSRGNIIEQTSYDEDSVFRRRYTFKYNSSEKMIELIEYDTDGSPYKKITYKYDSRGDKIEEKNYGYSGQRFVLYYILTYNYTFDKKDNWIKLIISQKNVSSENNAENDNPNPVLTMGSIIERHIEYYD